LLSKSHMQYGNPGGKKTWASHKVITRTKTSGQHRA
jgi:hypothetical protein